MSLAKRSARRRGMLMGAAISSSRNKKRQAITNANAQAPAQPAPAPAQPVQATSPDSVKLLRELADLRDAGILTEAEFTAKKQQILGL